MYREKELTDAEFERDVSRWSDESNRCYIATTPPMRERACRQQLREHGMTVFLPECIDLTERLIPRSGNRMGRLKRRRVAMFPGYLFLCFNARTDSWAGIDRTEATLMCLDDGTPIRLDAKARSIITRLQALTEVWEGPIGVRRSGKGRYTILDEVPAPDEWQRLFEIGQQVRINEGAFQGFTAILLDETRAEVKIQLSIFGREMVPTTMDKRAVS